jgi:hypothetical protein
MLSFGRPVPHDWRYLHPKHFTMTIFSEGRPVDGHSDIISMLNCLLSFEASYNCCYALQKRLIIFSDGIARSCFV